MFDPVTMVGLFFSGLFLIAAAVAWGRMAKARETYGPDYKPTVETRRAASASMIALGLLGLTLAWFVLTRV